MRKQELLAKKLEENGELKIKSTPEAIKLVKKLCHFAEDIATTTKDFFLKDTDEGITVNVAENTYYYNGSILSAITDLEEVLYC